MDVNDSVLFEMIIAFLTAYVSGRDQAFEGSSTR